MTGDEETLQYLVDIMQELNLAKLDSYTDYWNVGNKGFSELVWSLIGDGQIHWGNAMQEILQYFFAEIENSSKMIVSIILIAIGYFLVGRMIPENRKHMSDVAYFTCYSAYVLVVLNSFLELSQIARQGVDLLLQYLKVLIPTFATTIAITGKISSATVFYELTFGLIWLCEWIIADLLIPGVHFYVILVVIAHVESSDSLGGYVGLVESGINFGIKLITGAVVGLGSVQSLLSSAKDQVTQNSVLKSFSALPGVGNGFEFAEEVLLSCGGLVKNSVGIAGVIFLGVIALGPILTLFSGYLCFRFVAAALGPLWDKGMSKCMEDMAKAVQMLLKILGYSILWFLLSLLMIMVATGNS